MTRTKLAELARAATKGPWHELERCPSAGPNEACGVTSEQRTEYGHIVGIFQSDAYDECSHPVSAANAAYIAAASPDVVLSLLEHIEQLEAGLNDALGGLSEVVPVMEKFYALPAEFWKSLGVDAGALEVGKEGLGMLRSRIAALRSLANPERSGK